MIAATTARTRVRKRRRVLAVLASLVVVVSTGGYWLAESGIVTVPAVAVSPPASVTANGGVKASLETMNQNVTIRHGAAQISDGYALAKVTLAQGFAAGTRVGISWVNPADASPPLSSCRTVRGSLSCSSWLTFGLYYPIHTGACASSGEPTGAVTIADGSTYCLARDTNADGRLVDSTGQVLISKAMVASYLEEGTADPASTTCGGSGSSWCTPSGLTSRNVFYVVASVSTAGGNPSGLQSHASNLDFFLSLK